MRGAPDTNPTPEPSESPSPIEQPTEVRMMETISQLAGGLAHDFNNLLTVIAGHTELLLHALPPQDTLRRHAEAIRNSATRAAFLTNELLAFSRRQMLVPRVLDLNGLVATMRESLVELAGPEIQLVTNLEAGLGSVHLDPSLIERALTTMVQHARDSMPKGGTISVQTATVPAEQSPLPSDENVKAPCVMLAVADSGVGLEPEAIARIFEPFFPSIPGKASGLALATVHGIVQQSGGEIRVSSEPGQGTTFQLFFPCANKWRSAEPTAAPASQMTGKSIRVLLVEDETQVRMLLTEVLQARGFQVLSACDGAEALNLTKQQAEPIEILITDVMMPGMNGKELADQILAKRPDLHVLFMSGFAEDILDAGSIGGSRKGFMQKPFTPEELIQKVHEMLGN